MRVVRIILIVMVLVGFPALSWVYLNSGLRWRVNAQEETASKETLGNFTLIAQNGDTITTKDIFGKYSVVAMPDDSISSKYLSLVHTQFHVREDYQTLYLLPSGKSAIASSDSTWTQVQCISGCDGLMSALYHDGFSAAIIDDSLQVRGRYHLSSVEDMRKLVEHLAVVLPIEKRERIELKRGN